MNSRDRTLSSTPSSGAPQLPAVAALAACLAQVAEADETTWFNAVLEVLCQQLHMPHAAYANIEGTSCRFAYRRGFVDAIYLVHTHASRELVGLPDAGVLGRSGAYLGTPVREAGKLVGVLGLYSPRSRSQQFGDEARALLRLAAQMIALRLARSREVERREQVERALERASQNVAAARYAKSRFLSYISHEIRTPMTGVLGLSQLLLAEELTPEQRELVAGIQSSGKSLLQILSDVVDLAKIETGRLAVENVVFSPAEVIDGLVADWRKLADARGLSLTVVLADNVPRQVMGDPTRLRQMVGNLLSNAVNYTQTGGVEVVVSIIGELANGWKLQIAVTDTGIGITEEEQKFLFNLFSDGDLPMAAGRYGGAGLGLSLCKALSDLLGGDLSVASEPGRGSTFTLVFPVKRTKEDVVGRPRSRRRDISTAQKGWARVLLAEDNPENQILVRTILQRVGYRVDVVTNGREAVDAVISRHYDLVLMDIEMPGMGGADAAKAIRNLEGPASRLPIIALTAHAMVGDRERFLSQGMTGYLSKPVRVASLRQAVAEALAVGPETEES